MTIQNKAARLAARVAPYQEAVTAARKAGLTWGDLGRLFWVSPRAMAAACQRARRYEVAQLPLPDPTPGPIPRPEPPAEARPSQTPPKSEAATQTTQTPSPASAGGGFKNLNKGT